MKAKFQSVVLFSLMAAFLSACNEQQPQPRTIVTDASGNQYEVPQQSQEQGSDAMDTAVAAGLGAAVGSVAGNMLSRPSGNSGGGYYNQPAPVIHRNTTIIQKKTVVINKPAPIKVTPRSPAPSHSFFSGNNSRSSSFSSSRSFGSSRRGR